MEKGKCIICQEEGKVYPLRNSFGNVKWYCSECQEARVIWGILMKWKLRFSVSLFVMSILAYIITPLLLIPFFITFLISICINIYELRKEGEKD